MILHIHFIVGARVIFLLLSLDVEGVHLPSLSLLLTYFNKDQYLIRDIFHQYRRCEADGQFTRHL